MGAWKFPFDAINPHDPTAMWTVGIEHETYRRIANNGHQKQQARIVLVHDVLEIRTDRIYGGWSRPGKEKCYVYVGHPENDYHRLSPTICVPAPPGMLFLVFVREDGMIDDWIWRESSVEDPEAPRDVKGEILWPSRKLI
jgi:hypothetical protein